MNLFSGINIKMLGILRSRDSITIRDLFNQHCIRAWTNDCISKNGRMLSVTLVLTKTTISPNGVDVRAWIGVHIPQITMDVIILGYICALIFESILLEGAPGYCWACGVIPASICQNRRRPCCVWVTRVDIMWFPNVSINLFQMVLLEPRDFISK